MLKSMRLPALALLLVSTGCATSLTTLQIARPVEPKHFQATFGGSIYAPLGSIGTVIGQAAKQAGNAKTAAETGAPYTLSPEDQQDLITAGIGLAVLTPSAGYEMSVRTGIVKDLDVGLRYNVTSLRLDTKYRILHAGNGAERPVPGQVSLASRPEAEPVPYEPPANRSYDLAIGFGVSKYFFVNPIFSALDYVKLNDFSRWDFEVPVYMSAEFGEVFKVYGAPKYVYSRTNLDANLVNYIQQASNLSGYDLTLPSEIHTHFIGATAGIAVGYKYVHLMLELTGGYTICNPVVFGQKRNLGGLTLQPAAALNLRF
jgi:hypothetical protein